MNATNGGEVQPPQIEIPDIVLSEAGAQPPATRDELLAAHNEWRERAIIAERIVVEQQEAIEQLRSSSESRLTEERRKRSEVERSLATAAFRIVEIETENSRLEQAAEEAVIDPKTRLYNKRGLEVAYDALVNVWPEPEEPHALLFIDLDDFKQYNSLIGHGKTDMFVVAITEIFKENLRGSDILGRYGGDEFIALLPNTGTEMASQIADRLRESIKVIKEVEGKPVTPTLSVGVTAIAQDISFMEAFEPANRAMRIAKEQGRDKTIVLE